MRKLKWLVQIKCRIFREGEKKTLFVVFYYKGVRTPPPFVVPWESEIILVNIFVVVDVIGLETGFALETNRKRAKKTTEENIKNLNFTFGTLSS